MMKPVESEILPGSSQTTVVVDDNADRGPETPEFDPDLFKERGQTLIATMSKKGIESVNLAMVYESLALDLVEDFKYRIGRFVKDTALGLARGQGRSVITVEDIWAIIDKLDLPIPDDDEENDNGS